MKPIILTMGLNHTTAPIDVREQVESTGCLRDQARESLLLQINPSLLHEVLVLSTCNRTEIYTIAADAAAGEAALRDAFGGHEAFSGGLKDLLYIHSDRAAVEHLFDVACGIDSMLVGEFEILGQVREAYQRAMAAHTIGPILHQLFQQAVHVGKRARTETAIGTGATSLAYAGVALARQRLGDLRGKVALVVGAGEMGRRAAKYLVEDGACTVFITSRNLDHARVVADEIACDALPFSDLAGALTGADLVLSATKAPHLILNYATVASAMQSRPARPLSLIDIAVPRDIDPACRELPNVSLDNVDDLQELVSTNRAARTQAIAQVRAIVAAEADGFWEWHMSRRAAPVLSELDARAESIRQAELDRALHRLDHLQLEDRDRRAIAAMSAGIVKKLLAAPRANLKSHMQGGDGQQYLDLLVDLFDLAEI
ncbi:MAG: glutamyl-tRNA reductase [Rudaea sp.]